MISSSKRKRSNLEVSKKKNKSMKGKQVIGMEMDSDQSAAEKENNMEEQKV